MLEARLYQGVVRTFATYTILAALAQSGKPLSVGAIAEELPINISVVSRHLAILKEAGVLKAEKRGKAVCICGVP